ETSKIFPGSAKFRQSLALRVAIARYNKERNQAQVDFFVVDEGFGSLDDENVVKTKMALKELASSFDLFLIITHVSELMDTFDNKILIQPQIEDKPMGDRTESFGDTIWLHAPLRLTIKNGLILIFIYFLKSKLKDLISSPARSQRRPLPAPLTAPFL